MVSMAGLVLDYWQFVTVSLRFCFSNEKQSLRQVTHRDVTRLLRNRRTSQNPLNPFVLRTGKLKPSPFQYKKDSNLCHCPFYCRWRDLNPQGSLHTPLKRARIPIPPHRHILI